MKKYGHHAFAQAHADKLVVVGAYADGRKKYLLDVAFDAFKRMQDAAGKEGVELVLISGFRTVNYQRWLFERATKKYGSARKAARHVAPPGYSEHHTGTAVDVGDARRPKTDLSVSFKRTDAFKWFKKNADSYRFVLSFPKGNAAGVSYEPWHWRYIVPGKVETTETADPAD